VKVAMRALRLALITLAVLAALIFAAQMFVSGIPNSSACGWGWGESHRQMQRTFLQTEFPERLPSSLDLTEFACTGFQDLTVTAEFTIPGPDGPRFIAELDKTYAQPQNAAMFPDAGKTRHLVTYPDHKSMTYELPGAGILYGRTVVVTIPDDETAPWPIQFEGVQW
jgi:hypothetical protein